MQPVQLVRIASVQRNIKVKKYCTYRQKNVSKNIFFSPWSFNPTVKMNVTCAYF